jgi:AraC family transcriptional regulator, transcriptional activator of pobA
MTARISHFTELADFHRAVGFARTPYFPDFDLLDFATSINPDLTPFMPPFRKDWYQVVFKLNPAKQVWLNDTPIETQQTLLLFNSPNHVYSWQLDVNLRGFVLFFKPEFLTVLASIEQEFPFF